MRPSQKQTKSLYLIAIFNATCCVCIEDFDNSSTFLHFFTLWHKPEFPLDFPGFSMDFSLLFDYFLKFLFFWLLFDCFLTAFWFRLYIFYTNVSYLFLIVNCNYYWVRLVAPGRTFFYVQQDSTCSTQSARLTCQSETFKKNLKRVWIDVNECGAQSSISPISTILKWLYILGFPYIN